MAAFSFSTGLHFTKQLAFGVLAILGCIVVQCLILLFIFLIEAQIRYLLLQAQMLRRLYGRPSDSEQRPSGDEERSPKKAANIRVKLPNPGPSTQAQPVELPTAQTTPPKATSTATPIVETSTWQIKALVPPKMSGKHPYAMKQVDILAPVGPPGLGPPDPGRLSALIQFPVATFDKFEDAVLSTFPAILEDTPKSACQTVPSVAVKSRFGFAPKKPYREYEKTRDANTKSVAVFEDTEKHLGDVGEQSTETAGAGSLRKFARGSAIRKVQPAQFEDVQTNHHVGPAHSANNIGFSRFGTSATMYKKDARPDQSANTIVSSRVGTTAAIYKNVKPAEFGDLRDRFIDTSLLKKASRSEHQRTLPAKAMPPTPREAARKALFTAFTERESSRVQLSANYSIANALEFDEKAKTYNTRREKLAVLMPGGNLSIEDETLFPWLSAKDTVKPQVSTAPNGLQEELNVLPSPPTSSDEEHVQHQPRVDPAPLIAKASRAFQVLLQATRNMKELCPKCNSKFCPEGYERASNLKLRSARDFYLKSRGSVMSSYEGAEVPEGLPEQLPEIKEC